MKGQPLTDDEVVELLLRNLPELSLMAVPTVLPRQGDAIISPEEWSQGSMSPADSAPPRFCIDWFSNRDYGF